MSGKNMLRLFLDAGWEKVSQKGSHVKIKKHDEPKPETIPMHKELKKGTEQALLKRLKKSKS